MLLVDGVGDVDYVNGDEGDDEHVDGTDEWCGLWGVVWMFKWWGFCGCGDGVV